MPTLGVNAVSGQTAFASVSEHNAPRGRGFVISQRGFPFVSSIAGHPISNQGRSASHATRTHGRRLGPARQGRRAPTSLGVRLRPAHPTPNRIRNVYFHMYAGTRSHCMAQGGRPDTSCGQGSWPTHRTRRFSHNINGSTITLALERPRRTLDHSAGTGAVRGTEWRSTPRFTCCVAMQATAHGVGSGSGLNVYIRARS